jgi:hypothetical protein
MTRVTRRRSVFLALAVAGGAAGALAFWRRGRRRAHVDLYFADGSKASFGEGSAPGGELMALARDALAAARS